MEFPKSPKIEEENENNPKVENVRYQCDKCNYITDKKNNLNSHWRGSHGKKDILCTECGYATSKRNNLTKHIESVHEKKTKPLKFFCDQCGTSFGWHGHLTRHIASVH